MSDAYVLNKIAVAVENLTEAVVSLTALLAERLPAQRQPDPPQRQRPLTPSPVDMPGTEWETARKF